MRPLEPERTLWTFPDATFSYECRGCSACCKGLGIGMDEAAGEVEAMLGRYPEVLAFVRQRGGAWTAANPRGGCWFLDPEGLCRVEREHGRAQKPAACRLFPFNRIFRLGSWAVVDFNSVICPLRAPPPQAPEGELGLSGRVRHADLLAELATVADLAMVGSPLPAQDPEGEGQRLVQRERAIAQACFAPGASWEDALRAQFSDPTRAQPHLEVVQQALHQTLGVSWRAPGGEQLRRALLLTPSLRFNELYGPRGWLERDTLALRTLPRLWLLWLHWLADSEQLQGTPLSLQQATGLWGDQMPLAYALARWDEPLALPAGPISLPAQGPVRELTLRCAERLHGNLRAGRPAGPLLASTLASAPAHHRVAALRHLCPLLAQRGDSPQPSSPAPRRGGKRKRR